MSRATSVVIPCRNGEEYLFEALESIRGQTVPVREIVVVDDGSDSPICAPREWVSPPLRIVRTENRGLAAARNLGISCTDGEFVAFLDADDFWHERKIEEQEKALRRDIAAVACFTQCVPGPGLFAFGPYPPLDVADDEFLLVLWYNAFFPPSAVMVRRQAMTKTGNFREGMRNGEDVELWMRLLRCGRFVQVPEPLCYYRQHPNQFTSNPYRKLIGAKDAYAVMIAQHGPHLMRAGLPPDKLWDAYRNQILLVYYRRQFTAARRLLWDYWKDHPGDVEVLIRAVVSSLPETLVARLRGRLPTSTASDRDDRAHPRDTPNDWFRMRRNVDAVLVRK
jgi:glycosyltransferase involved in cell wall biosynthesis